MPRRIAFYADVNRATDPADERDISLATGIGVPMTDFNPLAGALLGSAEVHHQLDAHKQRQVRRAQILRKNTAAQADRFEHEVESPEEVGPAGEDPGRQPGEERKGKRAKPGANQPDDPPHVDIQA